VFTPIFSSQNILLSILFSNALNLHSSYSVRDQVSHVTKQQIKIVYSFMYFVGGMKTKDSEQNDVKNLWIECALNFFMKTILICCYHSQILVRHKIFEGFFFLLFSYYDSLLHSGVRTWTYTNFSLDPSVLTSNRPSMCFIVVFIVSAQ